MGQSPNLQGKARQRKKFPRGTQYMVVIIWSRVLASAKHPIDILLRLQHLKDWSKLLVMLV
ncbi:predicted protein [Nematostella vectensis]|uniref:Uncharacterized protein n=1 Tax=Nematostella vectensis TaxID=45351 RepID=A7RVL3_NEMVE|nr:predicted protein [Nematostella vectensis]|eukprot:XP_001636468.1 predicted protein [Nematostella vectensis]